MPLEISEVFSMAPLARGNHPTEYKVPRNFDWGSGSIKKLHEDLVSEYETLHSATNRYRDAEGRAAHYGFDVFKATLDKSWNSIRDTRAATLRLMVALYDLGQKPLPPDTGVDHDVARILDMPLLTPAAQAMSTKFPEAPTRFDAEAGSSKDAEARALKVSGVDAMPLRIKIKSGNHNDKIDAEYANSNINTSFPKFIKSTKSCDAYTSDANINIRDNNNVWSNTKEVPPVMITALRTKAAKRSNDNVRSNTEVAIANVNRSNSVAIEPEDINGRKAITAVRIKPMISTKSANRSNSMSAVAFPGRSKITELPKSAVSNAVPIGHGETNGGEMVPAVHFKPIVRTNSVTNSSSISAVASPGRTKIIVLPKSAVRSKTHARAVSATRPRLITRGALARARAESAWNERAKAESSDRAMAVLAARARSSKARSCADYSDGSGHR